MNWARKPGWRIAAKDRFVGGGALSAPELESFMREPSLGKDRRKRHCPRHLRQQDAEGGIEHAGGLVQKRKRKALVDVAHGDDRRLTRRRKPRETTGRSADLGNARS